MFTRCMTKTHPLTKKPIREDGLNITLTHDLKDKPYFMVTKETTLMVGAVYIDPDAMDNANPLLHVYIHTGTDMKPVGKAHTMEDALNMLKGAL